MGEAAELIDIKLYRSSCLPLAYDRFCVVIGLYRFLLLVPHSNQNCMHWSPILRHADSRATEPA